MLFNQIGLEKSKPVFRVDALYIIGCYGKLASQYSKIVFVRVLRFAVLNRLYVVDVIRAGGSRFAVYVYVPGAVKL